MDDDVLMCNWSQSLNTYLCAMQKQHKFVSMKLGLAKKDKVTVCVIELLLELNKFDGHLRVSSQQQTLKYSDVGVASLRASSSGVVDNFRQLK